MESLIGTLSFRDWDEGCVRRLNGELFQYEVDGAQRGIYAARVPGVNSGLREVEGAVPIKFLNPEDVFSHYRLPLFAFRLNSMSPGFDRKAWYGISCRAPAPDAKKIVLPSGKEGYDKYRQQWRPVPFAFSYDLMVMARLRNESMLMLTYALRNIRPPGFVFRVVDSKGDVREYDAGEVEVSNTSELADIADRTIAWTISFTAYGEVDLEDCMDYTAFTGVSALTAAQKIELGLDPNDPLYDRTDLILRTHAGVDPSKWGV